MEVLLDVFVEHLHLILLLAAGIFMLLDTTKNTFALYFQKRQNRTSSAHHGCQKAPELPNRWLLGSDWLFKMYKADQDRDLLRVIHCTLRDLSQTLRTTIFFHTMHIIMDSRNLEAVLSSHQADYSFELRHSIFFPLLGNGIFTQAGDAWKHSRNMLRPQFSRGQYENLQLFGCHIEKLLARTATFGKVVDLQPLFFQLTMDTITEFLFGRSVNSLEASSKEGNNFVEAWDIAQEYLARRSRLGNLYWLSGGRKFKQACMRVHVYVDNLIQQASHRCSNPGEPKNRRCMFLERLLEETSDEKAIRDQLVNILIAGRDTTACLLSWTFRLLVRNPAVLARLRREITAVVGISENITKEDLKKMTYLRNIINETLRLYPPVPLNQRTVAKTTKLPFGGGPDGTASVLLRPGETVGYCPYVMHRRTDIYGPDAEEFRPERWEEELLSRNKTQKWAYLPFNAGPRICLGMDFALLEASYTIVRILQKFPSINLPEDETVVKTGMEKQVVTLVLYSADGCRVKIG